MTDLKLWLKTLENLNFKIEVDLENFKIFTGIINYSPNCQRHYKIKIEHQLDEIKSLKIEFQKGRQFMHHFSFENYQSTTPDRFIKRHFKEFRNAKLETIV